MQSNEKNDGLASTTAKVAAKPSRPTRAPVRMGGRNVTTVSGKEPGWSYRIVNDVGDRIEELKARGYEVVTHDVSIGDRRVASAKGVGTPATLKVGGGITGVLMRIPQEFKDEDDKVKQAEVDKMEEAIKGRVNPATGQTSGDYGKVEISKS